MKQAPYIVVIMLISSVWAGDRIMLGDPASEKTHRVQAENTKVVEFSYPDYSYMTVRASAFEEGHEPWLVLDADPDSHWQVRGKPPEPMVRGQWIEVELDRPTKIDEVSVRWLGTKPYKFIIYEKPWEDFRRPMFEGESRGGSEIETYKLPKPMQTRAVRIEFEPTEDGSPQGIREIRLGGIQWPQASPLAVDPAGGVVEVTRPYYVEFERMLWWPVFTLRRALADGGTARIILPDKEEFEGGNIDFDVAVMPGQTNWITLKMWESAQRLMNQDNEAILLQMLEGDARQKNRTFLPRFITEEQSWAQEWYGRKPTPGRWVYAHYEIPAEATGQRDKLRLRLQGVGNARRDYPMREPSPPIYEITAASQPVIAGEQ